VTTQDILTYTKIAIAVLLICFGFLVGNPTNLEPLFQRGPGGGIWRGVSGVLLTTPFWLSGFNLVAQVMEEKRTDTPMHRVGGMIWLSIATSTVFYILIALACAYVGPWQNIVSADLPAAKAFELAFHSTVATRVVLLVALLGTFTVWNGCAIAACRMLFALGRAYMISSEAGRLHPRYRTPTAAVLFVGVCTALGVLLGRKAISPVINIASATYAVAYVVVSVALIRLRATHPLLARPFRVPGGVPTMVLGVLASFGFLGLALEGPWADSHGNMPPEWIAIIVWSVLGVVAWMVGRETRGVITPAARRAIILGELSSAVETRDAHGGGGVPAEVVE
jgi:amino acid transporter